MPRFEMERWQSTYERGVKFNLSESGIEPITLRELLDEEEVRAILKLPLGYAETRGSEHLRSVIASLYEDCGPENILATTGTSEANFLAALGTMGRGSRVVTILPNYMQVWGIARFLGCEVEELRLREEAGWQPDEEDVKGSVRPGTRAIALSNPNNPTGARLTEESRRAINDAASEADAWIISDEVYRGAERKGDLSPTLWGEYENVLVTSGLSKAFGLPGLRLGWICGPRDIIEELWSIHDYTTIAINKITEAVGALVLARWREKLWARGREIIRRNFPLLREFVERTGLAWVPPEAGAIAFLRYPWEMPSIELAKRALQRDVLLVPGSQFREEGYLRVGFGMDSEVLERGLARLESLFEEVDAG